mgnify:CR=1 FL=1
MIPKTNPLENINEALACVARIKREYGWLHVREMATAFERFPILQTLFARTPHLYFSPQPGEQKRIWATPRKKILLTSGANRSGKTEQGTAFTLHATLDALILKTMPALASVVRENGPAFPPLTPKPGRSLLIWVVALTSELARLLAEEYYLRLLPDPAVIPWKAINKAQSTPDYIDIHYPGDKDLKGPRWARIQFKTAEQGREKFQGARIDFAHVDEEIPKDVWRETLVRTADYQATILFTFTYLKGLTWAYDELYVPIVKGRKPTWEYFKLSLDKNEALSRGARDEIIASIPEHERPARVHGEITLAPANITYYPPNNISALPRKVTDPSARLDITPAGEEVAGAPAPNGPLLLWELPVPNERYVIGADPAGGRAQEGDPACAAIFRPNAGEKGRFVGFFHARCYPEEFGRALAAIGSLFNNAPIAVEANTHGTTTLRTLENLRYRNLVRQIKRNQLALDEADRPGIYNSRSTRTDILAALNNYLAANPVIPWAEAIREISSFIVNTTKDRAEAAKGAHDDIVFAMCYALLADPRFSNNAAFAIAAPLNHNTKTDDNSPITRMVNDAIHANNQNPRADRHSIITPW